MVRLADNSFYNTRLGAPSVWEIEFDPKLVDEAADLLLQSGSGGGGGGGGCGGAVDCRAAAGENRDCESSASTSAGRRHSTIGRAGGGAVLGGAPRLLHSRASSQVEGEKNGRQLRTDGRG